MNSRSLFIFAILGLLLVSSLDAAKAAKGKGKKGEAKPENTISEKPEVKTKAEKLKVEQTSELAQRSIHFLQADVVVVEESIVIDGVPAPKILRPKTLKFVSAYDKCKMECQKIRDQQDLHSYVAQLREELAAAEAALGEAGLLEQAQPAVVA
ncbi:hypothetical protein PMAYCL1PPCAC_26103 [Pristionchus mayeri]|uniref:Uncharacterized protein n=1 Tax=Pristionchus mayeri TaxID=1317129 RepID=A0AAN5D3D4_9BILA|nr:hypothetical protein PMAYCL1PPCAC_26103 [Pristionchus mayeri]